MYGTTVNQCETTVSNNITLDGLEPCTVYHVNITSVSISGQRSEDSLMFDTNTDDAGTVHLLTFIPHRTKWHTTKKIRENLYAIICCQ